MTRYNQTAFTYTVFIGAFFLAMPVSNYIFANVNTKLGEAVIDNSSGQRSGQIDLVVIDKALIDETLRIDYQADKEVRAVKVNSADKMQLLANELGVTKSHLLALIHVEAKNHKSLPKGKIPARFERHWMRKCLIKKGISLKGIHSDLSHRKRSLKKQKPYELVHRASKINKECAHYATSWSVFQIMGFNHVLTGHKSAVEMARKMHESPHEKYVALANFLKNHKNGQALKALKRNDWKGFARSYNGENYRQNRYDKKIMKAYRRIAGI